MEVMVSLSDNKLHVLKTLKPDSAITLFHGTSLGVALDMCHNGIDGRRKQHRLYPHYSSNAKGERVMVDRGVFCSMDLKVSKTFGHYCLKFKTVAKNVVNIFPSLDVTHDSRRTFKDMYPDSFRPEVSFNFINDREKQGLFIGVVRPNQIERVYAYDYTTNKWESMTVDQFVEKYSTMAKFDIKPLNMSALPTASLDMLVDHLMERYPDADRADMIDNLSYMVNQAKTFEGQIDVLETWATYPVAKKICTDMRAKGYIPKLPSSGTKTIYSGM